MSENAVQKIRSSLSPEAGKAFYGLVNTFGIHEDDDRLVILAASAMLLQRADELTQRFEDVGPLVAEAPDRVRTAMSGGLTSLDSTISEAVERAVAVALDMMTNEVRSLVRELVVTEMTTASQLRSQSIADEVQRLSRAAQDLANAKPSAGGVSAGNGAAAPAVSWMQRIGFYLGGIATALAIVAAALRAHH